ncbi:MAG TPA: acetyl-CoA carboxylase biotin carboxyl carrier protein [Blastocatellia bacterium]|nr:acetyl-CoA carboxylase biotin carboxyl carrier protein [Blastocatellia bacterium]
MEWKQLKELIELVSDKGFAEFEIERQGFRLRISNVTAGGGPGAPAEERQANVTLARMELPARTPAGAGDESFVVNSGAPVAVERAPDSIEAKSGSHVRLIRSPIVGTFYRAPSPNSDVFVNLGDRIEPDSVVCIIEAMKLMNEIQAEIGGIIEEIYAENGQAVEYDQPLFAVKV